MEEESRFDKRVLSAYEEYLKLPKAEVSGENKIVELYENNWCIMTGRSIVHPHPHRHYTLIEFAYSLGKKPKLYERFFEN